MPPRDREPGLSWWWYAAMLAWGLLVFRVVMGWCDEFVESLRVFK